LTFGKKLFNVQMDRSSEPSFHFFVKKSLKSLCFLYVFKFFIFISLESFFILVTPIILSAFRGGEFSLTQVSILQSGQEVGLEVSRS